MKYKDFYNDKDLLNEIKQQIEPNQLPIERMINEGVFGDFAGKAMTLVKKSNPQKLITWFNQWFAQQKQDMGWVTKLPECPCEMKVVDGEAENPDPKNFKGPLTVTNQALHPGAKWELRSLGTDSGQQCCYDSSGKLLTSGFGAGTADKFSPANGPVAIARHFKDDVIPFFAALTLDGGRHGKNVAKYIEVRPPNDGENCEINKGKKLNVAAE
jgi:hypothetical protein